MKVLLATDGSSHAEAAASLLARLPHAHKLDVVVLSVLQLPYVSGTRSSKDWVDQCVENERAFAETTFGEVAQMFEGADAEVSHLVREGHLGQTIVDVAEEIGAELIVLGARGHAAVERILLGSTSDYVATHAPCSVLVVRPAGKGVASDGNLHVAFAYDDSGPSRAAIEELSEFRWGGGTEFTVITVVSFVSAFMNEIVVDPEEIKGSANEILSEAAGQLVEVAPGVRSKLVESDHIGEGVVKFAESHHCDLVVVGDTGYGALTRALLGSVSRYVLRHVPCSVWISRRQKIRGTASDERASKAAGTN